MTITCTEDTVLTPIIYFKCKHKERMACNTSDICGTECYRTRMRTTADDESVKIAKEFFERFNIIYACDNSVIFSEIIEDVVQEVTKSQTDNELRKKNCNTCKRNTDTLFNPYCECCFNLDKYEINN